MSQVMHSGLKLSGYNSEVAALKSDRFTEVSLYCNNYPL